MSERCQFSYGSAGSCVYTGTLKDGLCPEHFRVEKRRKTRKPYPPPPGVVVVVHNVPSVADHSAPWKCSQVKCKKCSNKPSYNEWSRRVKR